MMAIAGSAVEPVNLLMKPLPDKQLQYNDHWKINTTTTSLYRSGMLRGGKNMKERLFGNTRCWSNFAPFEASDTGDSGLNRSR